MVKKCTVNRICIVFLAFVFLMLSPQETESQQANIMVEPIAQYPENSHVFLKAIPTLHFSRGDEVIETKFYLPEGTYQSQWTYILTGAATRFITVYTQRWRSNN